MTDTRGLGSTFSAGSDPIWSRLTAEAEAALQAEPSLSGWLRTHVLARRSLVEAVSHRVAARLGSRNLPADTIRDSFAEALAAAPSIGAAMRADVAAILDRDPACERVLEPVMHYKGFHGLQAHRLAHWLWSSRRIDLALFLQARASHVFQTDIHPAASFGSGIFIDHATGFVAGETVVVEDDVSILQGVTLGGTGLTRCERHPKIRRGVLIGAGAKVLGPIEVGRSSRVASGSVVLTDVPPLTTVAGVPARVVGTSAGEYPGRTMDGRLSEEAYDAFTYVI